MGVSLVDLQTILRLRKAGLLRNKFSVAEIGAQQLTAEVLRDPDVMPAYAETFGVELRGFGRGGPPPKSDEPGVERQWPDAPYAKEFWDWLGCPYVAIDYDTSPHIIQLDLNFDDVPLEHKGKYDLVTNYGTTEHVVNQMQAMKIMHDLTAVGGLMIHTVPTQGNTDHAMFNNPMFFFRLSGSCRYHIHEMRSVVAAENVPLPSNIVEFVTRSEPEKEAALSAHRVSDTYLVLVMQKLENIPFVPPIEIHGEVTDPRIRSRYWTVFDGR
jgi:hypothetical protein